MHPGPGLALTEAFKACTAAARRGAGRGAGGKAGSRPHGDTSTSAASARSTGPVPTAENWNQLDTRYNRTIC